MKKKAEEQIRNSIAGSLLLLFFIVKACSNSIKITTDFNNPKIITSESGILKCFKSNTSTITLLTNRMNRIDLYQLLNLHSISNVDKYITKDEHNDNVAILLSSSEKAICIKKDFLKEPYEDFDYMYKR